MSADKGGELGGRQRLERSRFVDAGVQEDQACASALFLRSP